MASAFDAFLQQAWADHADDAQAVAARLRSDTPAPESGAQIAALARFVVHLFGEHLGAFDDGRWRLAALVEHPQADAAALSALRVGIAGLSLAQNGAAGRKGFTLEESIRSEATAAAICVGRRDTARGMSLLRTARERLAAVPDAGAAVHRPLAVACNNMAWELNERGPERSAAETVAMLDIAAASKLHWAAAGTWLEVERADYCIALCHLSAAQLDPALSAAAQCLTACTQNDAPAYEFFFAHEALARVQHARGDAAAHRRHVDAAQAAFDELPADDQEGCRATLAKLKALGA
jgi:hypothetical protein